MLKKVLVAMFIVVLTVSWMITPDAFANSKGDQVANIAKKYIGVPYKWGGTTPSGFDCSGFMTYVFDKVGVTLPRTSADQATVGTAVSKSNLQPGDIVYFSNTYKTGISHSGIYVGNGYFVHAASKGVQKTSINEPYYWGPKYTGARRVLKEEQPKAAELPTLPKGQYHDVKSSYWAYEQITYLSKKDIITGYDQSLFKPENSIKRSEAAAMLAKAFNLPLESGSPIAPDVPNNHWAKEEINAVMKTGYFEGYQNKEFRPEDSIKRSEVAALFTRVFDLEKNGSTINFKDVAPSYWAFDEIQNVTSNNIANGYSDQTFKAEEKASRAEFSTFLYRAWVN
ncbi:S-layer homology domain-containing protein [Pseudalkalibacillus salsuginis]|uniref:C40 family peptidase n=1 Tax=Pseudalkalibacillus salsuginis TaxID=2910972 RepID=UPI001F3DBB0C|nr:C40 family peptidase [Pseudalkalibacillus salsuginis]MCF6410095.1 S-layer homology domain-containing protein [Pseudalkalibacillus salsuginis]